MEHTNTKSENNPRLVQDFYRKLSSAISVPSRYELFVACDFNGRLGMLDQADYDNGVSDYVGRHGMGKRNHNGHYLLNFMCRNELFATNTALLSEGFLAIIVMSYVLDFIIIILHPARHRTTHTHKVKNKRAIYSQIDYVLCKRRSKCLLKNSRSYAGTLLMSDHKLVACKIQLSNRSLFYAKAPRRPKMLDTRRLSSDPDCKQLYHEELCSRLANIQPSDDPNTDLDQVFKVVQQCAEDVIGFRKPKNKGYHSNDPDVKALVAERHTLRHNLLSSNRASDDTSLRY